MSPKFYKNLTINIILSCFFLTLDVRLSDAYLLTPQYVINRTRIPLYLVQPLYQQQEVYPSQTFYPSEWASQYGSQNDYLYNTLVPDGNFFLHRNVFETAPVHKPPTSYGGNSYTDDDLWSRAINQITNAGRNIVYQSEASFKRNMLSEDNTVNMVSNEGEHEFAILYDQFSSQK